MARRPRRERFAPRLEVLESRVLLSGEGLGRRLVPAPGLGDARRPAEDRRGRGRRWTRRPGSGRRGDGCGPRCRSGLRGVRPERPDDRPALGAGQRQGRGYRRPRGLERHDGEPLHDRRRARHRHRPGPPRARRAHLDQPRRGRGQRRGRRRQRLCRRRPRLEFRRRHERRAGRQRPRIARLGDDRGVGERRARRRRGRLECHDPAAENPGGRWRRRGRRGDRRDRLRRTGRGQGHQRQLGPGLVLEAAGRRHPRRRGPRRGLRQRGGQRGGEQRPVSRPTGTAPRTRSRSPRSTRRGSWRPSRTTGGGPSTSPRPGWGSGARCPADTTPTRGRRWRPRTSRGWSPSWRASIPSTPPSNWSHASWRRPSPWRTCRRRSRTGGIVDAALALGVAGSSGVQSTGLHGGSRSAVSAGRSGRVPRGPRQWAIPRRSRVRGPAPSPPAPLGDGDGDGFRRFAGFPCDARPGMIRARTVPRPAHGGAMPLTTRPPTAQPPRRHRRLRTLHRRLPPRPARVLSARAVRTGGIQPHFGRAPPRGPTSS